VNSIKLDENAFANTLSNSYCKFFQQDYRFASVILFSAKQCAKDCVPHNCACNDLHLLTSVFTYLKPKPYFFICALFFSKFLHVKNWVYQWNMQKNMVFIFLTIKATILDTQSVNSYRVKLWTLSKNVWHLYLLILQFNEKSFIYG